MTLTRRHLLWLGASAALPAVKLSPRERVDRALEGRDTDRAPFSLWYHFGLEKDGPAKHAEATLAFHRKFQTDLVKVMSDFPYPKPKGRWFELREEPSPFAPQLEALNRISNTLGGRVHFVETQFNPWNVAEKLSSKEEVLKLMREQPQKLVSTLEIIAKSQANHVRKAIQTGASGVFLAIANAQEGILTRDEYRKFSEPFDRMVLDAARSAPLNILHLHGDKVYLDLFWKGWLARGINYSAHGTKVPMQQARKAYDGILMGGLDEVNFRKLTPDQMREQIKSAQGASGRRFILAPGCSVPNDTADAEVLKLTRVMTA